MTFGVDCEPESSRLESEESFVLFVCLYLETVIDVFDATLGNGRTRQRHGPTSAELTHTDTETYKRTDRQTDG